MILTGEALVDAADAALDPEPPMEAFGPCSVDVRPALDGDEVIESGAHLVVPADGYVTMPRNLCAMVTGRSRHMRSGMFMPAGWVDPGYEGELKLELGNTSDGASVLYEGEACARLTFFRLQERAEPYDGRYGSG